MGIDIQKKKIELIQWLSTLNDESIIEKVIELREMEKIDWWKEISEEERHSIEKGIQDADSGKLTPHSEAQHLYEKYV